MDEVLVFMSVDLDWGYCWAHADVIGYYFVPVATHGYLRYNTPKFAGPIHYVTKIFGCIIYET
jgi:hypothetical protein